MSRHASENVEEYCNRLQVMLNYQADLKKGLIGKEYDPTAKAFGEARWENSEYRTHSQSNSKLNSTTTRQCFMTQYQLRAYH